MRQDGETILLMFTCVIFAYIRHARYDSLRKCNMRAEQSNIKIMQSLAKDEF